MAFIAGLLSEDGNLTYEALEADERGLVNSSWMIAPEERHLVAETPDIPPPIWKDAPGFPSDADLEEFIDKLEDLPAPSVAQAALGFQWGWARHDLIRYNRVEGPAIGGGLDWALGRRFSLDASGFFGLADLRPKVRLGLERSTAVRRLSLGAFHELRPTDPAGRYLDLGNSLNAFPLRPRRGGVLPRHRGRPGLAPSRRRPPVVRVARLCREAERGRERDRLRPLPRLRRGRDIPPQHRGRQGG